MRRYVGAVRAWLRNRLSFGGLVRETGVFYWRHWIPIALGICALAVAIAALDVANKPVTPDKVFGRNPGALASPYGSLPGGIYSPNPEDVFAPSDTNADTFPGFPPGTKFLPGIVHDQLTDQSVKIALAFWAKYSLVPTCPVKVHRYIDPDRQTLARSVVNGCDVFIDKSTPIPDAGRNWNAMGYCNLLVHEIGHNVGLQHSPSPADIMYFTGSPRARTGCQRYAPASYGTVATTRVPGAVTCSTDRAMRYWLSGDYARAQDEVSRNPGHC